MMFYTTTSYSKMCSIVLGVPCGFPTQKETTGWERALNKLSLLIMYAFAQITLKMTNS